MSDLPRLPARAELPERPGLPEGLVLDVPGARTPWSGSPARPDPDRFTFGLISDRTGDARPGVFERGVAALNALAPVFAVQVGDLIEGYTEDDAVLAAEWAEIDAMLAPLRMPLFHVAGNHDVANEPSRRQWLDRFGAFHYHFRYRGTLFLVLNTQDPEVPMEPADFARMQERLAAAGGDEELIRQAYEASVDWNGAPAAAGLSEDQLGYAEQVLAEHADARWTFVIMHMPLWQGEGHPAFHRLRKALGDRPYTMFSGHVHNYRGTEIDGRAHIRLGPTGGTWVFGEGDPGNVDHVTLVTMTADGPVVANLALDGIRDADGRPV
ncbi:metallophosphoesterase family protein [Yinghuangia soli]|uniref:Metallophosphoesterase n=1 Tax=Yinghuangia soli TaxID=2908204 RepID=A0AA41Q8U2_9ACTN|nr:metallophosphoesterase [Yinghuangia soli]MCF2533030.1 metallophosphoesterase [Yinghuangia soli]